jgi:hypothetical protein
MESKITIDIYENGDPYISINLKPSEDLRDKVLGRFLTSSGVWVRKEGENALPLKLWIVQADLESGKITAHVEFSDSLAAAE